MATADVAPSWWVGVPRETWPAAVVAHDFTPPRDVLVMLQWLDGKRDAAELWSQNMKRIPTIR